MSLYIEKNIEIQRILQNYGSPEDSIDEGFIDLTGALNYFVIENFSDECVKKSYEIGILKLNKNYSYQTIFYKKNRTSQV